jgi:hypothetical protein
MSTFERSNPSIDPAGLNIAEVVTGHLVLNENLASPPNNISHFNETPNLRFGGGAKTCVLA